MASSNLTKALALVLLMLFSSINSMIVQEDNQIFTTIEDSGNKVVFLNDKFDSSNFTLTDLRIDSASNEVLLSRPQVNWLSPQGQGLVMSTTGSCMVFVQETNEFWLLGGRVDPNPQQSGDEGPTQVVQIFDVANKTWTPASHTMVYEQQYHGCAKHGNKILTIGDHYPNSNPEVISTGMVQIYNLANSTWYDGAPMPSGKSVGMAGVTQNGNDVFVSGGVSRESRSDPSNALLKYDINNDTWTELGSMNANRYAHVLEYYHGKLYALGGFVRLQNANGNWQTQPANHTEVYDPVNDTWTNHTTLPWKIMGMASTVYNDEIILQGGYTFSPERKTYGYNPETGHMRRLGDISNSMFMSAMASGNNTILYAGGDASYWPFSSWSVNYLGDTQYDTSPDIAIGWLTSDPIDLRINPEGTATPHWIKLSGSEPQGTDLKLQYRTSESEFGLITSPWMPLDYTGNSTFLRVGNHTLISNNESMHSRMSWMQYRVNFSSTSLDPWITPDFDGVEIGAHQSVILSQIPTRINPYSEPITIQSSHMAYLQEKEYSLNISSHSLGINQHLANEYANLVYYQHNDSTHVVESSDLIVDQSIEIVPSNGSYGLTNINWTFSLSENVTGDVLTYNISSSSPSYPKIGTYHTEPNAIAIDRNLTISHSDYYSSINALNPIENDDILPANSTLGVNLNAIYSNTGKKLDYGEVEVRLHLDIEGKIAGKDNLPGEWFNSSTDWMRYSTDVENNFEIVIPSNTSGNGLFYYEARSNQDINVLTAMNSLDVIIDAEIPILASSNPVSGSYVNKDENRLVEINYADFGGLDDSTLETSVWIQKVHDTNNDGMSQEDEYQIYEHILETTGSENVIKLILDDSVNDDDQYVRVLVEGEDKSGSSIPTYEPLNGTIWWTTRTPYFSEILSIEPIYEFENLGSQLIEPNQKVGWSVTVSDANGISDITEVSLLLGGQENLGITYQISSDSCLPRDSRLQVIVDECYLFSDDEMIKINFVLSSTWSLNSRQLQNGRLDVKVTDIDGVNQTRFDSQWILSNKLDYVISNLIDDKGEVTGDIVQNWALKNDEYISFTGILTHNYTQRAYTGGIRITWDGYIGQQVWQGSLSEYSNDGSFSVEIPVPLNQGILNQATIKIKDSNDNSVIAEIEIPRISIDDTNPILRQPIESTEYSRYHLDEIIVAANVEEEISWNGNLSMSCQVKSESLKWEPLTVNNLPSSSYQGVSLFTFEFDFSEQGDPNNLETQAYISCWAYGTDDAGWELQTASGNTELEPWFTLPLNSVGPDLKLGEFEVPDFDGGDRINLQIPVINVDEAIERSFNITIIAEVEGQREIVARESFSRIDSQSTKLVRLGFVTPSDDWKMIVEIDSDNLISELDENNNVKVFDYTSSGLNSRTNLIFGSIGVLVAVIIVGLILKRGGNSELKSMELDASGKLVQQKEQPQPTKPAGPPKSIKPNQNSARPKGPPKTKSVDEKFNIEQAASALDVLIKDKADNVNRISGWEELPPGGEYEYGLDTTIYKTPNGDKWVMNDDKSFTKM